MIVEDVDEFSKFDTGRGAGDIFQYVNRNDLENFLVSVYSFLFEEFTERVEMREDDPTKIQHTQISLMQYLCTKVHQQHFGHHHQLYTYFLERNVKYLNFGMGAGYLEYWFKHYQKTNDIVSLEWEGQEDFFKKFRTFYNVDSFCKYKCNSIYSDDFKIERVDGTKFKSFEEEEIDSAILHRFFPVWDINSYERQQDGVMKKMFANLKKYGIKEILISTRLMEKKMFDDDMALIVDNTRLKRHSGGWEMWFVNIENIK